MDFKSQTKNKKEFIYMATLMQDKRGQGVTNPTDFLNYRGKQTDNREMKEIK